jgi:hypothetical protein
MSAVGKLCHEQGFVVLGVFCECVLRTVRGIQYVTVTYSQLISRLGLSHKISSSNRKEVWQILVRPFSSALCKLLPSSFPLSFINYAFLDKRSFFSS